MGEPTGKQKVEEEEAECSSNAFDDETVLIANKSRECKEEGNILFQKRDYEGALLKYEMALKILPENHTDVAYLRSNRAACYMQMGLVEYPRAIDECNLALEVAPTYSKALLKRARCYEGLNRLDLALTDANNVLSIEPNNLSALEILDKVKKAQMGFMVEDKEVVMPPAYVEPALIRVLKERVRKRRNSKVENEKVEEEEEKMVEEKVEDKVEKTEEIEKKVEDVEEKNAEDKVVVKEKISEEKVVTKTVKLVFGDDIRFAQLPVKCDIPLVRDIVQEKFPNMNGVLIKYRDSEGDLITITTTDELRLAEASGGPFGSMRLYLVEVTPDREPLYERKVSKEKMKNVNSTPFGSGDGGKASELENRPCCVEEWIIQFARLFKNHVGFETDSYLDLHELGVKLYSEAMEETVTSEDAQEFFEIAADKFQEMAALSLFNWGNVHLNRARKLVLFGEDSSSETILARVKDAYEWAHKEYVMAGLRYEESLRIKPDFYEGHFALGQQQFEQAKLSWYYAIGNKIDLETWPSTKVLDLYNNAEENMDQGMQMWEELEEERLNGLCVSDKCKTDLQKMGLDGLFKEITPEEVEEQTGNLGSQIYLLWGTILYERSIVEFKLELPTWEECLEVAVEKFELSGASQADIAVMIKNHISNGGAIEGFGFKIDEIIQAWNEMYDAKRWQNGFSTFRLEPLFRRRIPKLLHVMEHISAFCT